MDITVLAALLATGVVTDFAARYGDDTTPVRGAVVQIGSPLNRDLVVIVDMDGYLREYDRRIIRTA